MTLKEKERPLFKILKERSFSEDKGPLEKVEVEGKLSGSLELSGDLKAPQVSLTLKPENTSLKTPYLKRPLVLKDGEIQYEKDQIYLRNLLLKYGENFGEGIFGELSLRDKNFSLRASSLAIKETLLHEISEERASLREILEKYQLSFETFRIKELSYQGNLEKFIEFNSFEILNNLSFSGEIKAFSFKFLLNNETFNFISPFFNFSYSNQKIHLKESKVSLDNNSILEISGIYALKGKIFKS